jgi:hypothetical protein
MPPVPAAVPAKLTQQLAGDRAGLPVQGFAQDETRLGLPPLVRRRITAAGVQPVATVWRRVDHLYRLGAVAPTTGDGFSLALPLLNSAMCQLWVGDVARTCAAALNVLVRDKGAVQTARALRWPPHVATGPFPPSRPERNPRARLGRDLKDQLAHAVAKTLDALSDTVCGVMQRYSQAALQSLTGFAYFVQAVQTALHFPNV